MFDLSDQQERLLRARISLALSAELRRRPTDEEFARFLRVLCHAIRGFLVVTGDAVMAENGAMRQIKGRTKARVTEGGDGCL